MFVNVTAFVLATACASPEVLRGAARPPVGQSEAETTLEGKMEVITEDSDQGSRTLYFLIVGDRRVPLRFTARPLNLITGTRVRVRGQSDPDGTLVVSAIEKLCVSLCTSRWLTRHPLCGWMYSIGSSMVRM